MKFDITPVPKPRMTQSDRWKKRDCVMRYWKFKDEVRSNKITLPDSGFYMIFTLPMPKSWSKKKRSEMNGRAHQQTPDLDNLVKALSDAVFDDDCQIWDFRATKKWGKSGSIELKAIESFL